MNLLEVAASIGLILIVLWDAFEVVILPRRVTRKFRLARLFYRSTWRAWSWAARRIENKTQRDLSLSFYRPVSLVSLLFVWAAGLILGFACLHRSLGNRTFLTD